MEQVICKALKVPVENLIRTDPYQKDPRRQLADYLRKRFEILEMAMSDECAENDCHVSIFYPDSLYMLIQHWLQQILDLMPMTDPPVYLLCSVWEKK